MLNGLDLFSGIGGMSLALKEWVRPIVYCEIDPYCQGVLLSRMGCEINAAPIWDNINTLDGSNFEESVEIIYGSFPCQDISIAGYGKGLEGERSGLFFEIVRLAKEIQPKFIFLENVPTICSRGGIRVVREITQMGYDCRWCVISAASIGALHKRERWFLLAHTNREGDTRLPSREKERQPEPGKRIEYEKWIKQPENESPLLGVAHGIPQKLDGIDVNEGSMLIYRYACSINANAREVLPLLQGKDLQTSFCGWETSGTGNIPSKEILFEFLRLCVQKLDNISNEEEFFSQACKKTPREFVRSMWNRSKSSSPSYRSKLEKQLTGKYPDSLQDLSQLLAQSFQKAWETHCRENAQDRVARIKSLGNAVVPEQAKKAFKILMGIKG